MLRLVISLYVSSNNFMGRTIKSVKESEAGV